MRNLIIFSAFGLLIASCSTGFLKKQDSISEPKEVLTTNPSGKGNTITISFKKGGSFYYPLIAVWLENPDSSYIQTLYVSKSLATGVFKYGRSEKNHWVPASRRAPQALPYWSHKRGVIADDGLYVPDQKTAVPDAYSGATPTTGFVLNTHSDSPLHGIVRILLELNQNWDWNEFWTNDKYPGDEYYKYSCQPAVVYEAIVNIDSATRYYLMHPIGHSHYSGKNGLLYKDLGSLTTALHIADSIVVAIK